MPAKLPRLGHQALRCVIADSRQHSNSTKNINDDTTKAFTTKKPKCLTNPYGTRGLVPTARELEPVGSALTKLVLSENTASTSAANASEKKLQISGLSSIAKDLIVENREEAWYHELFLRKHKPDVFGPLKEDAAEVDKSTSDAGEPPVKEEK